MSDQEPLLAEPEEPEQQEQQEEPHKPEYRIVLLGKTAVGKNKIRNAILGNNRNGFEPTAVSEYQKEKKEFERQILTVVVTPDLFENRVTDVDVRREIYRCICFAAPGPHAFLVVFQAGSFTKEDHEIVRKIQQMFGEEAARYSMVLFTCEDDPEAASVTIDEFVSNNQVLSDFIHQCGGGYHVFNNRNRDPSQVRELLEKITHKVQRNRGRYYTTEMFRQADLRIVLVGKTGVGKSAAGNTILGQRVFRSTPSTATEKCQMDTDLFDGQLLAVVDTPGLFDTKKTQEEINSEISRSIPLAAPGPHAFLVVIQANRFTEEEQKTVRMIQNVFGREAARYTMALFTCGDNLEADNVTIEEVISGNQVLSDFIRECGGIHHVFNNRSSDRSQVRDLLKKINTVVQRNGGRYYTDEMFEKAERAFKKVEPDFRIVLVGKTRAGKSAAGNTILEGNAFKSTSSSSSVTSECQKETALVDFHKLAVVDTPGLFNTNKTEEQMKAEISRSISLAVPGPHVFLIVIQADRFTDEEQEIVRMIQKVFGREAARYTMVLFTFGDNLEANKVTIEELISGNPALSDFIRQCGERYHVFNNTSRDPAQVRELLRKIDIMVQRNGGSYYTNEMVKEAERTFKNAEPDFRIVLVGKTRAGKSAAGNTILKREVFRSSSMTECQKETSLFNFHKLAVVDTPGLFGTELTAQKVKTELARFISFAAPGPHVFLIVIHPEVFQEEEQETLRIIQKVFGDEAARYTMVLFTHVDDPKVSIEEFYINKPALHDLVHQCGGRCHVFNNKKKDPSQVRELLKKINIMVQGNGGRYYTNEMFEKAEEAIQKEMERLTKEKNMTREEARNKAERNNKFIEDRKVAIFIGTVLGVGVGVGAGIGIEAAVAGARIGVVGGPVGAAVGAVVGTAMGAVMYFSAVKKKKKKACALQ